MKIKAQDLIEELEELEESEGVEQEELNKDMVLEWFRNNPNPDDKKVHDWAEELDVDEEELEAVIYSLVTDHVKLLDETEDVVEEAEESDLGDFDFDD